LTCADWCEVSPLLIVMVVVVVAAAVVVVVCGDFVVVGGGFHQFLSEPCRRVCMLCCIRRVALHGKWQTRREKRTL
jgi:hypothetical protein